MTTGDGSGVGPLRVRADLHLVVGDTHANVFGDGSRLTMSTNDAPALFTEVVRAYSSGGVRSLRRSSDRVARLLDDAGLSLEIVGNRGPLVEFGSGCHSRLTGLVLGTERARLGSVPALAPALVGYLRVVGSGRDRLRIAAAGLAVAGVLGLARVRRRTS